MNTSATGGYLQPAALAPYPGSLTFKQFIQTVLVGVSGLPATLVFPDWQTSPPKQPDITVNWMAFGVSTIKSDTYGYNSLNSSGTNVTMRQEELAIECSFFGPGCENFASLMRDGLQIPQNLEALKSAGMNYVAAEDLGHLPDLVNERWIDRFKANYVFRRQIMRTYPILTLVSAAGTINTIVNQELLTLNWQANP